MKLSNKKSSDPEGQVTNSVPETGVSVVTNDPQQAVSTTQPKHPRISKKIFVLALVLIITAATVAVFAVQRLNKAKPQVAKPKEVTISKAEQLVNAKESLQKNPENPDTVLTVAGLVEEKNPEEAKQYYAKELELYKKGNSFNDNSVKKTAINYYAVATLAEKAGDTAQAKQYYELVIKTANKSNGYQNNIAKQSQAALDRLK